MNDKKALLYTFGDRATARVDLAATPGMKWVETQVDGRGEPIYSGLFDAVELAHKLALLARAFGGGTIRTA